MKTRMETALSAFTPPAESKGSTPDREVSTVKRMRSIFAPGLLLVVLAGLAGCSFFGGDDTEYTNWEPELSPDGLSVAYESTMEHGLEIFVRDLESGAVRRITDNEVPDWGPTWSPDGTRIAFASSRDKNVDIYVVDLETLVAERLTMHDDADFNAHWAVDGLIYFNSDRSGTWEIYTIDPEEKQLTKLTGSDLEP